MASKTFQQKYRVFSAAFWAQNGSAFDLEKSDKIVLPPSALNALTGCNAAFPVLLKIQNIDKFSNKALPSNIFSYVLDYSAPEGIVYMSSWMIERLKLDLSGQSIVELSLPTTNNLQFQCPTAESIQFQPLSWSDDFLSIQNIHKVIASTLSEFYSSLRCGDTVTIHWNSKHYVLTVTKITGKETSYTPKCIRMSPDKNVSESISIEFTDPEPQNASNQVAFVNDEKENHSEPNLLHKQHKENENENEMESDGEWEIVSVEKIKNLKDLEFTEPKPPQQDDIKDPPQIVVIDEQKEAVFSDQKEDDIAVEDEPEAPANAEAVEVITEWICTQCSSHNELSFKFCPKCGTPCPVPERAPSMNSEMNSKPKEEQKEKVDDSELTALSVQEVAVINDGPYSPSEQRQTGWIIKNVSGKELKIKTNLIRHSGDSDVVLKYEEVIDIEMKPEDEMFIMMEVTAPDVANPYHVFFQMVLFDDPSKRICDMLRLSVLVKGEFNDEKEAKIKRIYQMGFNDRKKIIQALKKWSWDELKAVNWLATH